MGENKNWILGRPLVHGDLEQIAEIARINKEKEDKKSRIEFGLDMNYIDVDVEKIVTSTFSFKCFKCDKHVTCEVEGVDLDEEDYNDIVGRCSHCSARYEIVNNTNLVLVKK